MFLETLRFTLRVMLRRPVRTLLTVLEVALGTAAVALVLSLVLQPPQSSGGIPPEGQILLQVANGTVDGSTTVFTPLFTDEDIKHVSTMAGVVVAPQKEGTPFDQVEVQGLRYLIRNAEEVDSGYLQLLSPKVVHGQLFSAPDYEHKNRVVVLSREAAQALYGDEQKAVGQTIKFLSPGLRRIARLGPAPGGSPRMQMPSSEVAYGFEVIGVIEMPESDTPLPYNLRPSHFLLPLGAATTALSGGDSGVRFVAGSRQRAQFSLVVQEDQLDRVKREITSYFQEKYGSRANIDFVEPTEAAAGPVNRIFAMFLGALALVGMLVSSIGILSIMMVSIVERTRELGLRRAMGASKGHVVFELLNEAALLAAIGAAVGLVWAEAACRPIMGLLHSGTRFAASGPLHVGLVAAACTALGAILLGILAGLLPAGQATRMSPLEALRD